MCDFKDNHHAQAMLDIIKEDKLSHAQVGNKLRKYYQTHKASIEYETPSSFRPENYTDEMRLDDMKRGTSMGMK